MADNGSQSPTNDPPSEPQPQQSEHLNIKVTDNNNEVFFKIKRTTQLKKLMDAFCERQGKSLQQCRFLFDGQRVNATDNPELVSSSNINAEGESGWMEIRVVLTDVRLCVARYAGRRYA